MINRPPALAGTLYLGRIPSVSLLAITLQASGAEIFNGYFGSLVPLLPRQEKGLPGEECLSSWKTLPRETSALVAHKTQWLGADDQVHF